MPIRVAGTSFVDVVPIGSAITAFLVIDALTSRVALTTMVRADGAHGRQMPLEPQ